MRASGEHIIILYKYVTSSINLVMNLHELIVYKSHTSKIQLLILNDHFH